ncbi:MAG: hypothetical protein WC631_02645 [Candidatus Paceibacterota bacterium]|jgi:hypothetical protein
MRESSLKNNTGFALAEMIVYVAIMTVITAVLVQSIITVVKSNKQSFASNSIKDSAITSLEKMTREIRNAESIDLVNSSLNVTNGILQINSKDSSGNPEIIRFYLQSNILMINASSSINTLFGPLTSNNIKVSNLKFIPIITPVSSAVKIEMTLENNGKDFVKTEDFYSTVILRGSY